MKPISPPKMPDQLRNNDNQKQELTKKQKWSFIFFMLNSGALYQIGMMITEYYFNNDRLPLSYHFLVGIATSIIAWIIEYLTKNKSHKLRKLLAAIIMIGMILFALFIPRPGL